MIMSCVLGFFGFIDGSIDFFVLLSLVIIGLVCPCMNFALLEFLDIESMRIFSFYLFVIRKTLRLLVYRLLFSYKVLFHSYL